jgi:hypothetical protein
METLSAAVPGVPRLRRTLTLWDLIFYGIVLIQPIAPVPLYGVAQKLSDGPFVTIILIALFAMLITAVSYGRMGGTPLFKTRLRVLQKERPDCASQNLSRTGNPEKIWAKQQFATHRVLMPGSEPNSVGPNAVSLRRRPEEEPR